MTRPIPLEFPMVSLLSKALYGSLNAKSQFYKILFGGGVHYETTLVEKISGLPNLSEKL